MSIFDVSEDAILDVSEDAILMSIYDVSEDANGEEKKTTGETATEPAADSSKAPDIDIPPETRQVDLSFFVRQGLLVAWKFYAKNCVNMRQKLSRDKQGFLLF